MLNQLTRTYKTTSESKNRIDVKVYYSKGGYNMFWGNPEPRGYYFSVTPYKLVDHGNGIVSHEYGMLSGRKTCILECERQSKKRFETATAMIDELIERLLPTFLQENGLELEGTDYEEHVSERRV